MPLSFTDEKYTPPTPKRVVQSEENDEETSLVLEPDHVLLTRFQQTLKEHLLKQILVLKTDVFEVEISAKKRSNECEQLGVEAYEAEQLTVQQHKDLEEHILELDNICSLTEEIEKDLEHDKQSLKLKSVEVFDAEKKNLKLRKELDGLSLLLQQMKQWEGDIESELTINQRMFEKTKKDKYKLAEEKRQLDMLVYKLMTQVWHLEEELELIDMQLRIKESEREKLAEGRVGCDIDVDGINTELKCIVHSWNSVVVATAQRDRHYNTIKEELERLNEKLSSIRSEVNQTKKLCTKETVENQRLIEIKERLDTDVENSKILMNAEIIKHDELQSEIAKKQLLMEQIEHDSKRMLAENGNKEAELFLLIRVFEKTVRQKKVLEDELLSILDQQLTDNKAAMHLNKLVKEAQEKNRNLEIILAKLENSQAKALLDIESQKCLNEEIERFFQDIFQQQNAAEEDLKKQRTELEKLRMAMSRRQKDSNTLANKIEAAISKAGGNNESPEEIRIRTLETTIEEVRDYIRSQQKFWFREQSHIVIFSEKRQQQICNIDMLRKQLLLLVQKNLKITDELDKYNKSNDGKSRYINKLHTELLKINEKLCQKKENKEIIEKANDILQHQHLSKLKESEMQSIKFEADISITEEDKTNLSNELIDLNREALTWEKKLQMMIETKKAMDAEQSASGDVGKMKFEIHRMEVRLVQLARAQEKLINDLEFCISRRECILTTANAQQKFTKDGFEKVRINFQRKLNDIHNQIKQIENEIEAFSKRLNDLDLEQTELINELDSIDRDLCRIKSKMEPTQQKITNLKIEKQMKLDLLVLKQKKLKTYSELAKNRPPYITYKTEGAISYEFNKQQELNEKLTSILDSLLASFPQYVDSFTMVFNTLKLPLTHV